MAIEFNKVTWYSKLLAVIIFLGVWAVGFCLGVQYEATLVSEEATSSAVAVSQTDLTQGVTTATTRPAAQKPDGVVMAVGDNLTLAVGETGEIKGLHITLNSFLQDSRCPVDVQCIQAGAVNVGVTLSRGPHTETKNFPSDEVPYAFDEYRISVMDVNPPRHTKVEISPGEYRITFRVDTVR